MSIEVGGSREQAGEQASVRPDMASGEGGLSTHPQALCCICGLVPVRRRFPHFERACLACRPVLQKRSLRRAQQAYAQRRYRAHTAAGKCGWCGAPVRSINYHTHKPYALCWEHRLDEADRRRAKTEAT